jgi:hypothetical protein
MSTSQWVTGIVVTLVAGGAMGAVINSLLSKWMRRRQPIVYSEEILHIFERREDFEYLRARMLVKDGPDENAPEILVENLSVARYTVRNKGNEDLNEYSFGR